MKIYIRKVFGTALLGLAGFSLAGSCMAVDVQGFTTGNDYEKYDQAQKTGYVTGVIDGLSFTPLIAKGALTYVQRMQQCLAAINATTTQLVTIADQYMSAHPNDWGYSMSYLTMNALADTCAKFGHRMK